MADPSPKPVALDAARNRAVRELAEHFAADHIDDHELERRLDAAYAALTLESLTVLTADLPALRADSPAAAPASRPAARAANVPERETVAAVLGGARRVGSWTVPTELSVLAVMGGAELDFREARFGTGVTEVNVFAVMGGVEILVPPSVRVEMNGIAIMGAFDMKGHGDADADPDAPVLRIGGFLLMAGVDVRVRLPGENARDAKKRERLARQEQRRLTRGG
jgi:hypothetical protein